MLSFRQTVLVHPIHTMFRNGLFTFIRNAKAAYRAHRMIMVTRIRNYTPITMGLLTTAYCDEKLKEFETTLDAEGLEHDFLIRQATTTNVNAASQLLTVTLVAIQDTSER